jgi:hypothetical protein
MSETEIYDAIWDRSRLIFTDEDRAKLKAATVSLNGLGESVVLLPMSWSGQASDT